MKMKDFCATFVVGLILIGLISGCSWPEGYGKLRTQPRPDRVAIEALIEKWDEYHVYWLGLEKNPSALLFDPKHDERKLVPHEWWEPVKSQEELSNHVLWIKANHNFPPILWRVLGPDDQFYGYIYSFWQNVRIEVIDEKTLWVDEVYLPPFDYGTRGEIIR